MERFDCEIYLKAKIQMTRRCVPQLVVVGRGGTVVTPVTAGVCAPEVGLLHQLPARYSGGGLGKVYTRYADETLSGVFSRRT